MDGGTLGEMVRVLITGASRGIGRATAELFLEKGHTVVAVVRNRAVFTLQHPSLSVVECDLRQADHIARLIEGSEEMDVLVNNAGIMHALPYDAYPEERKRELLAVNLEAPVQLITGFAPRMVTRGGGRIVNVASIAGEIGSSDVWYGATKAALINVTKSFARYHGKDGLIINAVAPGPVTTDLFSTIPQERRASLQKASYSGVFPGPEAIASVIYWLSIESPPQINGCCIDVNDGAFPR